MLLVHVFFRKAVVAAGYFLFGITANRPAVFVLSARQRTGVFHLLQAGHFFLEADDKGHTYR